MAQALAYWEWWVVAALLVVLVAALLAARLRIDRDLGRSGSAAACGDRRVDRRWRATGGGALGHALRVGTGAIAASAVVQAPATAG